MNADRRSVAALIPAYCEENHIRDIAARAAAQLDVVLVVDDGSPDATSLRAGEAGARVERHAVNQGKGAAIKTGLRMLGGEGFEWVLILDGDGQHLPEEIPRFLEKAGASDAKIIVGSRMEDTSAMPFVRRMTNRIMSAQISRLCGQAIPDSQCGFRMLHRSVIPQMFCETAGYDYETEMLLIAARAGFSIASVPVSTIYGDEKSKIRPVRDTLRFIRLIRRYQNIPRASIASTISTPSV